MSPARTRTCYPLLLALSLVTAPAFACDSDADCGPEATCIKREKRASGVCYGRDAGNQPLPEAAPRPAPYVQPRAVTGERRERAEQWLGSPEEIIHDQLPGQDTSGACMVTQDCAEGWECVIAGFEGRCVKF